MTVGALLALPPALWAAVSDIRRREIPLTAIAALAAVAAWATPQHWGAALVGAVVGLSSGALLHLATGRRPVQAFGLGDVLLLGVAGVWAAVPGVLLAYVALFGTAVIIGEGRSFPAAPSILAGIAVAVAANAAWSA